LNIIFTITPRRDVDKKRASLALGHRKRAPTNRVGGNVSLEQQQIEMHRKHVEEEYFFLDHDYYTPESVKQIFRLFWQSDKWGRFGRLGRAGLGTDKNKQIDRFQEHLSGAFGGAEFQSSSSSSEEEGLFGNLHKHQHGKQPSGRRAAMGGVPTIDVF
jgi:hypothetical protein